MIFSRAPKQTQPWLFVTFKGKIYFLLLFFVACVRLLLCLFISHLIDSGSAFSKQSFASQSLPNKVCVENSFTVFMKIRRE